MNQQEWFGMDWFGGMVEGLGSPNVSLLDEFK